MTVSFPFSEKIVKKRRTTTASKIEIIAILHDFVRWQWGKCVFGAFFASNNWISHEIYVYRRWKKSIHRVDGSLQIYRKFDWYTFLCAFLSIYHPSSFTSTLVETSSWWNSKINIFIRGFWPCWREFQLILAHLLSFSLSFFFIFPDSKASKSEKKRNRYCCMCSSSRQSSQ